MTDTELDAMRQERDAALADLANLQIAFNDWKVFHSTTRLEIENEVLRALLWKARSDWIKVGYGASHEDVAECRDLCDIIDAALSRGGK